MVRSDSVGRSQRALAFLGLALALGFSARLPLLMASAGATLAALRPVPGLQGSPGLPAPPLLAAAVAPPPLLATARAPVPISVAPAQRHPPNGTSPPVMLAALAPPDTMPPPISPAAAPYVPPAAFDMASQAYARLAAGDRRGAARLFDAAIAAGPDPRAAQWQRDRAALSRRWSGEAYALLRDGGTAGPAASPVLGGGQSGAGLAWTIDPLARRPLAIVARTNAASDDPESAQAAIGVRWRPLPGISISAERLIAIGAVARNEWTLRLAAGAEGKQGPINWNGYGEAGVLGNGDVFAGGQARAVLPLARIGRLRIGAGPGGWASIQTGGITTSRVDIGPSLVASTPIGSFAVDVAADWRFRVAGNAEPGSGPALTVSTRF